MVLLTVAVVFFPISKTYRTSGRGAVLTNGKEKIGDCDLSVEIHETASLAMSYRKTFSFVIDDTQVAPEYLTLSRSEEAVGLCYITQIYYDKNMNTMARCFLLYPEDQSYAVIGWKDSKHPTY